MTLEKTIKLVVATIEVCEHLLQTIHVHSVKFEHICWQAQHIITPVDGTSLLYHFILIISATTIVQEKLDELLQSIETSIVENQPVTNWQKRMEVREESWESLRCQLFEEVIMYSSMPVDSVSKVLNT